MVELGDAMEPLQKNNILQAFRNSSQVQLAYIFGSRVEGATGPQSDYDFAVLMQEEAYSGAAYHRLRADLARVVQNRVDLVLLEQTPVELAFSIIAQGALLYEVDAVTRVDYESRIMSQYGDYLPVLRTIRSEIIKGGQYAARVQRYRKALGRTGRTLGKIGTVQNKAARGF